MEINNFIQTRLFLSCTQKKGLSRKNQNILEQKQS